MASDRFYLIVRDRVSGQTEHTEFEDAQAAVDAYAAAEAEHRAQTFADDPQLEIVLIAGESLHAVRAMYPHYFAPGNRETRQKELLDAL